MYELLTGPLLWFSFAVFFIGLGARVWLYFKGLDWRLDRVAYTTQLMPYGLRGAWRSLYKWLIPFGTHSWREKPVFTVLFFVFHIGLVVVPILLEGHVVMIRNGIGLSWPTLPQGLADFLAIAAFLAGVGIGIRRFALPEVRILTDFKDVALLVLTLTLLASGIMAARHTEAYMTWLTLHVLCGHIVLLAAPFTKLAHIALFFCTRIQLGMDFGIKRGGMKTNFDW